MFHLDYMNIQRSSALVGYQEDFLGRQGRETISSLEKHHEPHRLARWEGLEHTGVYVYRAMMKKVGLGRTSFGFTSMMLNLDPLWLPMCLFLGLDKSAHL